MELRDFKANGISIKTPDTFKPNFATTSTEDSDRTQDLVMHNTPMGTIQSYSCEWKYIEPEEAANILGQILNRSSFTLEYPNALRGQWESGVFYATNFSMGSMRMTNGVPTWESLSFNVIGVNPV